MFIENKILKYNETQLSINDIKLLVWLVLIKKIEVSRQIWDDQNMTL
jgi:hypothetical protein